jgi:hypothetical protein
VIIAPVALPQGCAATPSRGQRKERPPRTNQNMSMEPAKHCAWPEQKARDPNAMFPRLHWSLEREHAPLPVGIASGFRPWVTFDLSITRSKTVARCAALIKGMATHEECRQTRLRV